MAWLSGWSRRKKVTVTGTTAGAQTDFQLMLDVTYDSDMLANFDDLRFTLADGTTLIDFWLESKVDSTSAVVWTEVPSIPANPDTVDIYMYYGKADAVSASNGTNTFINFATGGIITRDTTDAIHTFTSNGTFTSFFSGNLNYLVVAGGGGGGSGSGNVGGGGGGAGGFRTNSLAVISQEYPITVGAGGAGGVDTAISGQGSNSIFSSITSLGGGAVYSYDAAVHTNPTGGSGGGGVVTNYANYNINPGAGTAGQGYAGGDGILSASGTAHGGGGGGGASVVGAAGTSTVGGNGGNGNSSSIIGTATYYAGGGGGGCAAVGTNAGAGGLGGGGVGGDGAAGSNATVNTGGGGGAGGGNKVYDGGNGGSGIVIVRYVNRKYASPEPTYGTGSEENAGYWFRLQAQNQLQGMRGING